MISRNNSLLEVFDDKATQLGCLMLEFEHVLIRPLQNQIGDQDINHKAGGLEERPHVTVLYGFDVSVDYTDFEPILYKYPHMLAEEFNFAGVGLFETEDCDVLRYNVENKSIVKLHNRVKKLPNTYTFPGYIPHMTIAYLQKGRGAHYVDLFKTLYFKSTPSNFWYADSNIDYRNF
jgi:2'-5' RNA ligase